MIYKKQPIHRMPFHCQLIIYFKQFYENILKILDLVGSVEHPAVNMQKSVI